MQPLQALQIATSSVARAAWRGSGVVVDGMTEWSSAEVADSLVWIAVCGYERGGLCHRGEYPNGLLAAKGPCVSGAFQALKIATPSSVARAAWCGSGVVVDGMTEWSGAEVADSLVWIAACGGWRRGEYANVLLCCQRTLCVRCTPGAADRDQLCS